MTLKVKWLYGSFFAANLIWAAQTSAGERAISVQSGYQQTFTLTPSNSPMLTPGPARRSPIGPTEPKEGEIIIGLAPAGHAVSVAKLHAEARLPTAVTFEAIAMDGAKQIATELGTACLDGIDSWITFPAGTRIVVVSHFVEAKGACK